MARVERVRRVADTVLVGLFIAALAAPLAAQVAGVGGGAPAHENRTLAPFPALRPTLASLQAFPAALGRWHQDHFGLRGPLIRWHNRVKAALGVSGVPRVLLGKEDWLFLDRDSDIIEQYRGLRPLNGIDLATWRHAIENRHAWLAARGIGYLVVVVPEKHTVYPEYLPDRLTRAVPVTPFDQLQAYVSRKGPAPLLDLRPAFARAKAGPLLYERTDTHWSSLGAFVGYREIVTALAERHRLPLVPRDLEAFRLVPHEGPGGDLPKMLALDGLYRETRLALLPREPLRAQRVPTTIRAGRGPVIVYETGDRRLPRAVVFHDSFALALMPFLSEHFDRVVYVKQRDFTVEVIDAERPDVVIHEMAERTLIAPIRDDPALRGAARGR